MAVRAWLGILLGGLMVAAAVTFFVVVAVRDDDLLDHGVRVTGTVVGVKPGSDWNLFDEGRLVVRYSTPAAIMTREIWLDDAERAQSVGSTVTVVFAADDPDRVRSLLDPNDPVPWGQWVLLAGAAGLGALIWGGRRVLDIRGARWSTSASDLADRRPILRGIDVPEIVPLPPTYPGNAWDHPLTRTQWTGHLNRSAGLAVASLAVAIGPVPLEKLRVAAGTMAVIAICAVGRAVWWRSLLMSGPWQRWSIQVEADPEPRKPPVMRLTAVAPAQAPVEVVVRLAACNSWAMRSFAVPEGTGLFLPGPGRSGVLLIETGKRPFGTRLPRSERQWARWRAVEFRSATRSSR
jgi:hypothetical protein